MSLIATNHQHELVQAINRLSFVASLISKVVSIKMCCPAANTKTLKLFLW
jgi:hypothetical protein